MNGSTPAHYAAIYGQLSTLKLLLEDGGNRRNDVAKEKDTQGLTVLHLASLKGDEQVTVIDILCKVIILCNGYYPCVQYEAGSKHNSSEQQEQWLLTNQIIKLCVITLYAVVKIIGPVTYSVAIVTGGGIFTIKFQGIGRHS